MENAILHTASAEKDSVEIDDIIASMFEEQESYAAHFLARQGIDRLALLSYISHGVTVYPESTTTSEDRGDRGRPSEATRKPPRRAQGAGGEAGGPRPAGVRRGPHGEGAARAASIPSSAGRRSSSAPSRSSAAG